MAQVNRAVKWVLPVAVSGGTLIFLLTRIDFREMAGHVDARVALVLVPSLLAYGAWSLWIEALSLARLLPPSSQSLTPWICAKIKAASYPLALVHYALGAGALALLLRRRGSTGISDAAGIVTLIALFDLGILLVLTALGAALISTRAPAVQVSLLLAALLGIAAGFAFLRTSFSLGPLERVRNLDLFRAAREARAGTLVELGALRFLFVSSFIAMAGAALAAFGILVPVGDLIVNVAGVSLVVVLPIAVSGLGTGQVAFVYLFRHWAEPEALLACSLTLSAGMIVLRAGIGLLFARELTREALAAHEAEA
jgi:hypothetical protein